jgi:single-strand DNA-binding protein
MANLNMAKVIVAGKITADPKLSTTANGTQVAEFSVAVNFKVGDKNEVSFFDCRAFGKKAEFICRYFTKGMSICIDGTLRQERWTKDGAQRSAVRVVADQVHFVDSKNESTTEERVEMNDAPHLEEIGETEEWPF